MNVKISILVLTLSIFLTACNKNEETESTLAKEIAEGQAADAKFNTFDPFGDKEKNKAEGVK